MVGRKNRGLESRAFLPLAIGGQAEHPSAAALQPCRESQAGRERETVPKTAGREANARYASRRRMSGEQSIVLVEPVEITVG